MHSDWTGGKLLTVHGKTFVCSAYIKKDGKGWYVVDIAPYLAKILYGIPIEKWGREFDRIGATYVWKGDDEIVDGFTYEQGRLNLEREREDEED